MTGGLNPDGSPSEVHIRSPYNPACGLQEAVDVLTDALLLARCGWVLHAESHVTHAVALISPYTEMIHITDLSPSPAGSDLRHGRQ